MDSQVASFTELRMPEEWPAAQPMLASSWSTPLVKSAADGWSGNGEFVPWPGSPIDLSEGAEPSAEQPRWRWADNFAGKAAWPHHGGWETWSERVDFPCFEEGGGAPGGPVGAVPEPSALSLSLVGLTAVALGVGRVRRRPSVVQQKTKLAQL